MALGKILRDAREALGMSTTEVAEHTNMMVQIVTDLENEDFKRIAAPIYGRGFLKLYAELLDLEAQPLIDEFMDIYTGNIIPTVQRRESIPDEVRKPVPIDTPTARQEQNVVPQRVEVVPGQTVRAIKTAPKPLQSCEDQPQKAPAEQPLVQNASVPSVSAASVKESKMHTAAVDKQSRPHAERLNANAPSAHISSETPPEPGDDLFDADEPNLFNTSPLQERIAEARRLMDEKEDVIKEEKKVTSLHIGANQRLPVFQIGGRMEKTYGTKSGTNSSVARGNFLRSMLSAISAFFSKFTIGIPDSFKTSQRSIFVFGSVGVLVLVFLLSGVMMIFKMTKQSSNGENKDATATPVVQKVEKPVKLASKGKDEIPPPPDMYFD